MSKKQEGKKQEQQSELESLMNLSKKPLTPKQVFAGFFLSVGGIIGGMIMLVWVNVATPGLEAATPFFSDTARTTIISLGLGLIGTGGLSLYMMWRELTRR